MRAKYRVIERLKSKYPIQKMCEIFKVSRSGFYKWRKRMQQPAQRSELDQIIITCQAQTNQTYGYRRVLRWMQRNNTQLYNASTVLRHMRKLDLLAQIRRRRPYTLYKQGGHRYENLLNRQFAQNKASLFDACKRISEKMIDRAAAIQEVSRLLRNRATRKGIMIDDVYRNENGIGMQMRIMESMLL